MQCNITILELHPLDFQVMCWCDRRCTECKLSLSKSEKNHYKTSPRSSYFPVQLFWDNPIYIINSLSNTSLKMIMDCPVWLTNHFILLTMSILFIFKKPAKELVLSIPRVFLPTRFFFNNTISHSRKISLLIFSLLNLQLYSFIINLFF